MRYRKEGVNKTRQNKPGMFRGGTNEEMQFMPCCTSWCESATLSVTGTILGTKTCRCLILTRLILNQISSEIGRKLNVVLATCWIPIHLQGEFNHVCRL